MPIQSWYQRKRPLSVITEMQNYVFDEKKDKPADKQSDHGIDALRYFYLYRNSDRGAVPVPRKEDRTLKLTTHNSIFD